MPYLPYEPLQELKIPTINSSTNLPFMETHNTKTKNSDLHSKLGLYYDDLNNPLEQPEIVSILASVLERSIHTNEKLLKKTRRKEKVTIFHGTKAPTLSIRQYIGRVFKYSRCSPSCFVVAYIYMEWFIQITNSCVTSLNVHRLLITCVLVAVKFLEDECYNNSYFAKIGGVTCAEMNKLELKLLSSLNYRLHLSLETFDQWCVHLEKEGAVSPSSQLKWTVQSCGLKGSWFKNDRSKRDIKCDTHSCKMC